MFAAYFFSTYLVDSEFILAEKGKKWNENWVSKAFVFFIYEAYCKRTIITPWIFLVYIWTGY